MFHGYFIGSKFKATVPYILLNNQESPKWINLTGITLNHYKGLTLSMEQMRYMICFINKKNDVCILILWINILKSLINFILQILEWHLDWS